jgi:hypothetical protein
MMPMPMPRKAPGVEKVEIRCRNATAQKILPVRFGPPPRNASAPGLRTVPDPLPDMSHSAVEFYECCANPNHPRLPFPKIRLDRAKLLAMQRYAS